MSSHCGINQRFYYGSSGRPNQIRKSGTLPAKEEGDINCTLGLLMSIQVLDKPTLY